MVVLPAYRTYAPPLVSVSGCVTAPALPFRVLHLLRLTELGAGSVAARPWTH